jgi:hypothetical protein
VTWVKSTKPNDDAQGKIIDRWTQAIVLDTGGRDTLNMASRKNRSKLSKLSIDLSIRQNCRRLFDNPAPPACIQEAQFDGNSLAHLIQKDWRELERADLWGYWDDLAYVPHLQGDLFRYLFPICMALWHECLLQNQVLGSFYRSMHHGHIFETMLNDKEGARVHRYIIDAFMTRIEEERGFQYAQSQTPAYTWLYAFNNLGALMPIRKLWDIWWTLDTPGKAVSAIMYASGLVYCEGENPIFPPWTREQGGGGPYLTELDICFADGWREDNLRFMRETLSPVYLCEKLAEAASRIEDEPEGELAARIATESAQRHDIIAIQSEDMLNGLQNPYAWMGCHP